MNAKNLIGQRFGRLLVVSDAPRHESAPKQKWYHCECDCGNEIDVCTYQLTSGNVRSCGCLQAESRFRDITGERRGYLTATRPTGEVRDGSAVWVWHCDCGKEIEAAARNVGPGGRTSCGCKRRSLNEAQAAEMRKKQKLYEGTNISTISNDAMYSSNTSGVRGVSWHRGTGAWVARITVQGKTIGLGYYAKLEDAKRAREEAENEYFEPLIEGYEGRGSEKKNQRKISKDLTGMRFGRLTVIRATDERVSGRIVWICQCDCGNEVKATSSHLLNGNTKSCGCAREGVNRIDLGGERFGRLVVLGPTKKRSGNSVVWRCRCDCGNEIDVSAARLRGGQTKSCGCFSLEVHKESFKTAKKEREKYQVEGTDVKLLMHAPIKSNTSGKAGVSFDRSVGIWKATIVFKGHKYYLGSSVDKEKAIAMREEAEKMIHGDFLRWYYEEGGGKSNGVESETLDEGG